MRHKSQYFREMAIPYFELLREHRYRELIGLSPRTSSERYAVVRSLIILGEYEEAEIRLRKWRTDFDSSFFENFLRLQLKVYRGDEKSETLVELMRLCSQIPQSDYLVGEYHFICGYALNRNDEYQHAIRYHIVSADVFESCGLPAHAAAALSNLCLSYNHLNEGINFQEVFKRLKDLSERQSHPSVVISFHRILFYERVALENFRDALLVCELILKYYKSQGRLRDVGIFLFMKGYILAVLGRDREWLEWESHLSESVTTEEHIKAIGELRKLRDQGTVSTEQADGLLKRWTEVVPDSVKRLFLIDLLLRLLERCQQYESLIRIARIASQMALQKQLVLCLIETRYYEIIGLWKTGEELAARRLLATYASDASEQNSIPRIQKADHLRELMNDMDGDSNKKGKILLTLDSGTESLRINQRTIRIGRYPRLIDFFEVILREPKRRSVEEVFEKVYRVSYHPAFHEKRISSLLSRAREAVGDPTLIERKDGKIGLASHVKGHIEYRGPNPQLKRREQILKYFSQRPGAVTIADLEKQFGCTRRTLQLDLQGLVASKRISCSGKARHRKYQLENP